MYIHLKPMQKKFHDCVLATATKSWFMNSRSREPGSKRAASILTLPCACANLRRTARLVTQLYEQALRPAGVGAAQFTLLQALKLAPGISQRQLAELLGIDSTTLTRTLAPLRRQGCLRSEPGADRRALRLVLTDTGEKRLQQALPYWQAAQKHLKQVLGAPNWNKLMDAVVHTAEAVR
jgi:DNA-binding MarR family transcriptional regulator